jgi:hypothetical protein
MNMNRAWCMVYVEEWREDWGWGEWLQVPMRVLVYHLRVI